MSEELLRRAVRAYRDVTDVQDDGDRLRGRILRSIKARERLRRRRALALMPFAAVFVTGWALAASGRVGSAWRTLTDMVRGDRDGGGLQAGRGRPERAGSTAGPRPSASNDPSSSVSASPPSVPSEVPLASSEVPSLPSVPSPVPSPALTDPSPSVSAVALPLVALPSVSAVATVALPRPRSDAEDRSPSIPPTGSDLRALAPRAFWGQPSQVGAVGPAPSVSSKAAASPSADAVDLALYRTAHRLHFGEQNWAAALDAWDAYLRDAPVGTLRVEAAYNRALCLVRLGRNDEARDALAPFAEGVRYRGYRRDEAEALLRAIGP